jgi:hypothetical protein
LSVCACSADVCAPGAASAAAPEGRVTINEEVGMASSNEGNLRAFVQTAEQAGGFVWIIALVDFSTQEVKRALVSEENFSTADAARDAGQDRLKGMSNDR